MLHFRIVQPENGITISDALGIMNSGATFDLKAVTLDMSRNTGGKRIHLKHCTKVGGSSDQKKNGTVTVKEMNRRDYPVTLHMVLIEEINGRQLL